MFCKYNTFFGTPNQGIHSYRIFDIAIIDVILTLFAAMVVAWLINCTFWLSLLFLFVTSILLHRLFCVRTTVDKLLF